MSTTENRLDDVVICFGGLGIDSKSILVDMGLLQQSLVRCLLLLPRSLPRNRRTGILPRSLTCCLDRITCTREAIKKWEPALGALAVV
jgi:hypothetical protein